MQRQIQQQHQNFYMKQQQQQTNYYEINQIQMSSTKTTKISSMQQESRTLEKIPNEIKRSRQGLAEADSELRFHYM